MKPIGQLTGRVDEMADTTHEIECDLIIIGSGMAGMAAALFAARRNIDTVQVGVTGEINFASGMLDLLGVHPVETGNVVPNPWDGIQHLCRDCPQHPYAHLPIEAIRTAMASVIDFLGASGLAYTHHRDHNTRIITPAGTIKTTYAVPMTMSAGALALEEKRPTLLVDIRGLKGYSALQIKETLAPCWPGLETLRIPFPHLNGDLSAERLARALQAPENRKRMAEAIAPHLGNLKTVAMPAILGVYRPQEVAADLSDRLGVPVFEIPTMLPAVTGLRLRETFETRLPGLGIRTFYQQRVASAENLGNGRFRLELENASDIRWIVARSVVLASGRFFGQGLTADRNGIRESLFDLPVYQPPLRAHWHHKDLLNPAGHPVNRAGLDVDDRFRPLDRDGQPLFDNLTAAGSLLAHQDWIREKCGSGLAVATAYGAVEHVFRHLSDSTPPGSGVALRRFSVPR